MTDIILKGTAQAFTLSHYTIGHDFTPRTNDFHQTLITDVTMQPMSRTRSERRNLRPSRVCVFVCFISTGRWTEFLHCAVCRRRSAALLPLTIPFVLGVFRSLFSTLLCCLLFPRSDEVWWSTGRCDSLTTAHILSPIWVCDHTHTPCSSLLFLNLVHGKFALLLWLSE